MSVDVSIPDEILNMNPSELPEPTEDIDTQQQPTQDAANVSQTELNFFPLRVRAHRKLNAIQI